MKILVIEDHQILSRNIIRFLASQDIQAKACYDGKEGEYQASTQYYDIILLDINLPKVEGLEVCKNLRAKGVVTPIIMLTSRGTSDDIITGLDIGADDYLVKPFEYGELLARIKALTRRNLQHKSTKEIQIGELVLNLPLYKVYYKGKELELTTKEFDLLKFLAQKQGEIVSREEIYKKVWGESGNDFTAGKTLDVYVGYLRKKISKDIIETKKGRGYTINKNLGT